MVVLFFFFFEDHNAKNMYELVPGANYELKLSTNCAHLFISSLSVSSPLNSSPLDWPQFGS